MDMDEDRTKRYEINPSRRAKRNYCKIRKKNTHKHILAQVVM